MKLVIEIPDDLYTQLVDNVSIVDNLTKHNIDEDKTVEAKAADPSAEPVLKDTILTPEQFLEDRIQLFIKNYLEARPKQIDVSAIKIGKA